MVTMLKSIINGPLLLKEIRTRMRARTVLIVENLYIVGICVIVFISFVTAGSLSDLLGWEIGKTVFSTITYVQALMMLFVGPLVAASAITMEKDQKTFDSLCVTPVSIRSIVWAKLLVTTGYFLMLILVSMPLVSISFILGGVAPTDILKAYVFTVLCTASACAMGLYCSTKFECSIASVPAASICRGIFFNLLVPTCFSS